LYLHLSAIITSLHDTQLHGGTECVSIFRHGKKFLLLQNIRDDFQIQLVSHSMVIEGFTPLVKSKPNC